MNPIHQTLPTPPPVNANDVLRNSLTLTTYEKKGLPAEKRPAHFYLLLLRKPYSSEASDFEKSIYSCLTQLSQHPEKVLHYLNLFDSLPLGSSLALMSCCYKLLALQPADAPLKQTKFKLLEAIEAKFVANNRQIALFEKATIAHEVRANFIAKFRTYDLNWFVNEGYEVAKVALPMLLFGAISKKHFHRVNPIPIVSDVLPVVKPLPRVSLWSSFRPGWGTAMLCATGAFFLHSKLEQRKLAAAKYAVKLYRKQAKSRRLAEIENDPEGIGLQHLTLANQLMQERAVPIKQMIKKIDPNFKQLRHYRIEALESERRKIDPNLLVLNKYRIPAHLPKEKHEQLKELILTLRKGRRFTLEQMRTETDLNFKLGTDVRDRSATAAADPAPSKVRWHNDGLTRVGVSIPAPSPGASVAAPVIVAPEEEYVVVVPEEKEYKGLCGPEKYSALSRVAEFDRMDEVPQRPIPKPTKPIKSILKTPKPPAPPSLDEDEDGVPFSSLFNRD